jgi:hypothetical protein
MFIFRLLNNTYVNIIGRYFKHTIVGAIKILQWTSLLENKNQLQKNDYLQRLIKRVVVS